jgi:hypothetical protein
MLMAHFDEVLERFKAPPWRGDGHLVFLDILPV